MKSRIEYSGVFIALAGAVILSAPVLEILGYGGMQPGAGALDMLATAFVGLGTIGIGVLFYVKLSRQTHSGRQVEA